MKLVNNFFSVRTEGYEPFIDYVKGVCIVFVILNHCIGESIHYNSLYPFWGDMAVPLFLMIQSFHVFKKKRVIIPWRKVWQRVLKWFLVLQIFLLGYHLVVDNNALHTITDFAMQGGYGHGSYYVWVYVQFAIILPFSLYVYNKTNFRWFCYLFLCISECFEIILCYIDLSPVWYRLIAIRYLFVIPFGVLMVNHGSVRIDRYKLILSVVGIIFIYAFCYTNIDVTPFFFIPVWHWRMFHWPVYFYTCWLFLYVLFLSYGSSLSTRILSEKYLRTGKSMIIYFGKHSYEIFLIQMGFFALFPWGNVPILANWDRQSARIIYIALSLFVTLCLYPAYDYIFKCRLKGKV